MGYLVNVVLSHDKSSDKLFSFEDIKNFLFYIGKFFFSLSLAGRLRRSPTTAKAIATNAAL